MNGIGSGAFLFLNGIRGNSNGKSYAKQIAFYKKLFGGLREKDENKAFL